MAVALKDSNSVASAIFESSTTPNLVLRGQIDQITGRILVDSVGAGSNTFVYNEVVAGATNTFTLALTPVTGMYAIYGNGQRLTPGAGNDFTITGAVVTTTNVFSAGQVLSDYQY